MLDRRLADHDYLAGDYSIADMATYPWVVAAWPLFKSLPAERAGAMENVAGWLERVGERPAVQRGMKVPALTISRRDRRFAMPPHPSAASAVVVGGGGNHGSSDHRIGEFLGQGNCSSGTARILRSHSGFVKPRAQRARSW